MGVVKQFIYKLLLILVVGLKSSRHAIHKELCSIRELKDKLELCEFELETTLVFQHLKTSSFKDMDDLQKRLVLFVKGINTNLAQESEELEEGIQQMADEVEALVLHHARKVSQQM